MKLQQGDIVKVKHLLDWGECVIKEVYGNESDAYYEVSPLNTDGLAFLLGLQEKDLELIRPAPKSET